MAVVVFFGDATDQDLADRTPPDPAAVARILYAELRARVPGGWPRFDDLAAVDRTAWTDALRVVLDRLALEWER